MPDLSTSPRIKREREHSADLYSVEDAAILPTKRQRVLTTNLIIPDAVRAIYEQLLPNPDYGIKFMFSPTFAMPLKTTASRLAVEYRITEDEAIEEFRRLLAIKSFTFDEKATKISPTPLMDQLWHAAILNTQFYASLQEALGVMIHHRPEGACDKEAEQRAKRLFAMEGIYKTFFSNTPLKCRPPAVAENLPQPTPVNEIDDSGRLRLRVKVNEPETELYFEIKRNSYLGNISKAIAERLQIPRVSFSIMFDGFRIQDCDTPGTLDMYDGHFVLFPITKGLLRQGFIERGKNAVRGMIHVSALCLAEMVELKIRMPDV